MTDTPSPEALALAEQIIYATGGEPKRAREAAVLIDEFARQATAWQPIETYPYDVDGWGEDALVLMPTCSVDTYGAATGDVPRTTVIQPFVVVAHMEGVWVARDPNDPICWIELIAVPTHWMPIRSRP